MQVRHVLVPTDFSAESRRAYSPAASWARENDARLTLLHVVVDGDPAVQTSHLEPGQANPRGDDQVRRAEERFGQEATWFAGDLRVETVVATAREIGRAVAAYAAGHAVDLIISSTHGRSGMARLFLGSVAESILRYSHVPVVLYPPTAEERARANPRQEKASTDR